MTMNRIWKLVTLVAVAVGVYTGYREIVESSNAIKANGGEVRFDDSVTEAEAQSLADFLVAQGYFSGNPATVRATKEDGVYQLQFVYQDNLMNDPEVLTGFAFMAEAISQQVFSGADVVAFLADEDLDNVKEIAPVKLGELTSVGKIRVYRGQGVTEEQARSVADELSGDDAETDLTLQILSANDAFEVKMLADRDIVEGDPQMAARAHIFASALSIQIFHGAPVSFHFCDGTMNSFLSASSTDPFETEPTVPAAQ